MMTVSFGDRVKITGSKYKGQGGLVVSMIPIPTGTPPDQQNCKVKLDESDDIVDCLESQLEVILED